MTPEPEALPLGGKQPPNLPANSGDNAPALCEEEIEVKELVVLDERFEDGKLVEKQVIKKLEIDIEGNRHHWHRETITASEIAALGGWGVGEGVLHIDSDNNERTLNVDEDVRIEVGVSFSKKVRFKRG